MGSDESVRVHDRDGASDAIEGSCVPTLRAQQIAAIYQFTPVMTVATIVLSLLFVFYTSSGAINMPIAVWSGLISAVSVAGLVSYIRSRRSSPASGSPTRSLGFVVAHSVTLGLLWGVMPLIVLPASDDFLRMFTVVAMGGVLCISGFTLSALPHATVGFLAPALLGSLAAAFLMPTAKETGTVLVLLVGYTAIIGAVNFRQARNFVANFKREATIREQKNIIGLLLKEFEENSSDWLWEFDRERRIDRVSNRFAEAAGSAGTIEGREFCAFISDLVCEDDSCVLEIEKAVENRVPFRDLIAHVRIDGEERWWRMTGKPMFTETDGYAGYIGTMSDITLEKAADRHIQFLAHNDKLTGLLNRTRFTEHLNHSVARLERYGSPFSVLFIDLDQFKMVNDSRGHLVGDKLLSKVSKRLLGVVREHDIVARLGGDEFAIIVPENSVTEEIDTLAQRVIERISEPYEIDGGILSIGVSIGIAIAPINGTRPDQILRNADLALYRAKEEGRGTYRIFDSRMDADVRERRVLEAELREALRLEQLELYFQPLVSAEDSRPVGFEALLRWNHPIRGLVTPAEFIPIAEKSGLINEIGDWTIREACRIASGWPGDLSVAVNVSARHFHDTDILQVVSSALDETGFDPSRLEIEVTETLFIENQDDVNQKLHALREVGVSIALDDFGTGYSSLSYLMRFPFDKIKIDRSFISALSNDEVAQDILRSIASLGATLRMCVTAEGVESLEQIDFLRGIDCDQLQGFYFARPLDQAGMASYLLRSFGDAAEASVEKAPDFPQEHPPIATAS